MRARKGRLYEGLRAIRRLELDATVVKELMREAQETEEAVEAAGLVSAPKKIIMSPSQYAVAKKMKGTP